MYTIPSITAIDIKEVSILYLIWCIFLCEFPSNFISNLSILTCYFGFDDIVAAEVDNLSLYFLRQGYAELMFAKSN